ncbi:MAG TPA: hypothetical protein GX510_09555 [Firmicutes bacterium]|nr:hypothetical protein [Candidatus Fermentithermobacillaceae bacterium]
MEQVVKASVMYTGPGKDVLCVFVEPTPDIWIADPVDDDIAVFRVVDEGGRETGEIAGVEILDITTFSGWDSIPKDIPSMWQVEGKSPMPLVDLLRSIQEELRRYMR